MEKVWAEQQNECCEVQEQRSDGSTEIDLKDAISDELYQMFAYLGKWHLQKEATASVSGEEGLLHYLAYKKNGVSSGYLKEQLEVGSGRMADILKRMEEKQLILRKDDPKDSRRVIVFITEQGREHAMLTNDRLHAWYRKLQEYLGEQDSRELLRILRRLASFPEEQTLEKIQDK